MNNCLSDQMKMATTSNEDQDYVEAVLSTKFTIEGGTVAPGIDVNTPTILGNNKKRHSKSPENDSANSNKPSEKKTLWIKPASGIYRYSWDTFRGSYGPN